MISFFSRKSFELCRAQRARMRGFAFGRIVLGVAIALSAAGFMAPLGARAAIITVE